MSLQDVKMRTWWTVLIRGIAAVLFGLLALVWPSATLLALVLCFGAYALVDGVLALIAATREMGHGQRVEWLFAEGVFGVLAGLFTLIIPGVTALMLLYFIAAWAVLTGITEIVQAIELRREISNEWLLILSGVISVLLGVALALFPGAGALSLIWVIGIYAIFFGALLIGLSLRLRGEAHDAAHTKTTLAV